MKLVHIHMVIYLLVIWLTLIAAREGKHHRDISNAVALANSQRFVNYANRSVYGAMIFTDPNTANLLGRDFYRVPQGVNGTALDNANARVAHGKKIIAEMPFLQIESWWSVFAQSCPLRATKGNDRGVAMAHFQIWLDWVYQGKKGVDRTTAKDDDIMIVFEDDAVIAVQDVNKVMHRELSTMNTDLLFLGWCYGHKRMPMCTHAYAVSRKGAKRMIEEWDTCSTSSIDGQWKTMAQHGLFSWSKVKMESYKDDIKPGFEDNPNYFTRGVFVQKNGFVSFNHHGFQNNANG